ncbi:MAG: Peptidyl-prolyl cis-trans isomerase [Verrucomicrobiota bacterium]|jgi:hypothetical protein
MLGSIRKHSTWLWGIIIGAMAISLVVWTGNRNTGHQDSNRGLDSVLGKEVTQAELIQADNETRLQYFFTRREWLPANLDLDRQRQAYIRIFKARKAESLGIHISDSDVARLAAMNLQQFGIPKDPSVSMATVFEQQVLAKGGLTIEDFDRLLRHDLAERQLMSALGISGQLVTTNEARMMYEHENQEFEAQAAFFSASNFLSSVTVSPAALAEFYTNQMPRYRTPERIQVSFVTFAGTNHWTAAGADLAGMSNQLAVAKVVQKYGLNPNLANMPSLDALLDAEYKRKTNFYTGVSEDKAKATIKSEIQHMLAMSVARRQASEFADPLLSAKEIKAESLVEAARANGLTVSVSSPFDATAGPVEIDKSENLARALFSMPKEEPISQPIVADNAVFVAALNNRLPSENPPYETIKARVESDFKLYQAYLAATSACRAFASSVTNELAQGKTFAAAATKAKGKPVLLPPFSLNTTNALADVEEHMPRQQFLNLATSIPVGGVSPFLSTSDGAAVIYVSRQPPLDNKKTEAELPAFLAMMRQARQQEAFQQWFNIEASRELGSLPIFRRPSEMGNADN